MRRGSAFGAGRRRRGGAGADLSWPSLFAAFTVCHLGGDLILQTQWQAFTKTRGLRDPEGRRALLAHAATYTVVYAPALAWVARDRGRARAAATCALIAVPHVLIDDGHFVRAWLRYVKHSPEPAPSLRLMVDQSFHVVCLFATALSAAAEDKV